MPESRPVPFSRESKTTNSSWLNAGTLGFGLALLSWLVAFFAPMIPMHTAYADALAVLFLVTFLCAIIISVIAVIMKRSLVCAILGLLLSGALLVPSLVIYVRRARVKSAEMQETLERLRREQRDRTGSKDAEALQR